MATYGKFHRSSAFNWFMHRISGTFLVFLLLTHFWVQHYDARTASISSSVVTEEGQLPVYSTTAQALVEARRAENPEKWGEPGSEITSYDVTMLRLADPVYAVLWKGFNIFFLIFALHHGFYGLNNVLSDYIRNPMLRVTATTVSWLVALALLIIGLYSVITAGLG
jgi:succinate dehydrogenase / fumarate reductase membrane anchor subunit